MRLQRLYYREDGSPYGTEDRVYRVYNSGVMAGVVAKRVRPYRWVIAAGQRFDTTAQDTRYASYSSRTEACRALLREAGFNVPQPAPTTRTRGTTGRGRAFGVEMEITGPSWHTVKAALEAAGINIRDRHDSYGTTSGSQWEIKYDGSVHGTNGQRGMEIASPKLRGEAGFAELKTVCDALNSVGATVNRTCGLHVHHDLRNQDADAIKAQVLAFVERQDIIGRLVAPSRRGNGYSAYWSATQIEELRRFAVRPGRNLRDIAYIGPRGSINLQSYARHGTVEVRFHGGTTNFAKIAAWVRFAQNLFDAAIRAARAQRTLDVSTTDPRAMLTAIGTTHEDMETLLRFVRAAEQAENREEAREMSGVN
jgi:hypothetical protein